jgi:hypothetical protein
MGKQEDKSPADPVRFPVLITREIRAELKALCAKLDRPMEDVAGEWLTERVEQEAKARQKGGGR